MRARLLKVNPHNPDLSIIRDAASIISSGGLVAFPTETVYGLGADGLDSKALVSIFAAKERPVDNPLILHISELSEVDRIAFVTPLARKLMKEFWPGPLTLVLRAKGSVPTEARGGLKTVAVRMPSNEIARLLIKCAAVPIAAPSANRSGRPSPTDADAVCRDLGERIDMIIDGGSTAVGLESTVLDVTGEEAFLLRPGGLSVEDIFRITGPVRLDAGGDQKKMSPGTRYRHYAPIVPLFLYCEEGTDITGQIEKFRRTGYIGMVKPSFDVTILRLFPDIETYARELFSVIREMENLEADAIIAEYPPSPGIGLALRDRLKRASGGLDQKGSGN